MRAWRIAGYLFTSPDTSCISLLIFLSEPCQSLTSTGVPGVSNSRALVFQMFRTLNTKPVCLWFNLDTIRCFWKVWAEAPSFMQMLSSHLVPYTSSIKHVRCWSNQSILDDLCLDWNSVIFTITCFTMLAALSIQRKINPYILKSFSLYHLNLLSLFGKHSANTKYARPYEILKEGKVSWNSVPLATCECCKKNRKPGHES